MQRAGGVTQSTGVIICLPWLYMQLTAVSPFRAAFKSSLPPGNLFVLGGERCILLLLWLPLFLPLGFVFF